MSPYRVISIQVGRPRTFEPAEPDGKRWRSAILKEPVRGPVALGREGLEGDAQVDRRHHGGVDRALLAYCADHFAAFGKELGIALAPGSFGENLTTEGLPETEACIGDTYALGGALLEVSQPRLPCYKLARRLSRPEVVERALATARSGFYLRVLREGQVEPGPLLLVERPFPALTVASALQALLAPEAHASLVEQLVSCPPLSSGFRQALERRTV